MRSRYGRRGAAVLVAALTSLCAFTTVTSPANAAEPNDVSTEYTNARALKYSSTWQDPGWGRARERARVEWADGKVRGIIDLQVDWPTNCQLTAGFPPSVSGGCSTVALTRDPYLPVKSTHIAFGMTTPNELVVKECHEGKWNPGLQFLEQDGSDTRHCVTDWTPMVPGGTYKIDVRGVSIDILHDDKGDESLAPFTQEFTASSGRMYRGEGKNKGL